MCKKKKKNPPEDSGLWKGQKVPGRPGKQKIGRIIKKI